MPLIVEDGTRPAGANTYVDVAAVEAYGALMGKDMATWNALPDEAAKEARILRSAQYLEGQYGQDWSGYKQTGEQSLTWPRLQAMEFDYYLEKDFIPERVQNAQCELAIRAAAGPLVTDQQPAVQPTKRKRKVGPLETEDEWGQTAPTGQTFYTAVQMIVEPLLSGMGSGIVEVERA